MSPQDFVEWRTELKSISDLGAFRDDRRNLITADGRTDLVKVAAMTASGFRLMRTPPLLGRALLEEDERAGAAPVLVIGYDQWQRHFDGDARVIGASVRLDATVYTIVGVMPEGFLFPFRHQYWVPLELTPTDTAPDDARLVVFGRVADGLSLTDARAELAAVGERMARAFPQTDENVRPQVMPYTQASAGIEGPQAERALRSFQLGAGILLLIVAVNVAILVYARTAARTGEIVVRTALGARRGRIVWQLFVEALAVLYVASIAVLAAVVVGVMPALKATGRAVHARLQQFSARGSGMQLGRIWTALIVVQVAIAVAVLPATMHNSQQALDMATRVPAPGSRPRKRNWTASRRALPASTPSRIAACV